ncbi:immunoglobulin domain-containing protein [Pedosphaera parvula]|uniref:Immunoglobulin I-set domain protein n=1 Tax=Pedosphaera parvula (strain Ellin514) TaxID=320771 RepID=B9XJD9_PEDPL|nr:immunoglobulin domain-containing protein [Pedosphaera parvula]EEF60000.1 Immunoglobulin I-set domain protein [Pedosphaera parvula Ellin514]
MRKRAYFVSVFGIVLLACLGASASTVIAVGGDGSGESDVPAGLTNVVAIASGLGSSLALNADGSVVPWGATYFGPPMPTDLTNVVAISATSAHNLVLRSNGLVAVWGEGLPKSFLPAGVSNVVQVATGFEHSLTLKSDGTIFGWGSVVVPAGLTNVVGIAAGGLSSAALKADGTVVMWGDNGFGQNDVPADLTNVVAVAPGGYHCLALKGDGTVVAWGWDSNGQTEVPVGLSNVVAIAAGYYYSVALKADGTVVSWGANYQGQNDLPSSLTNVVAISAGYEHSLFLTDIGIPQVVQSPMDVVGVAERSVLFRAGAVGKHSLGYQWKYNGTELPGANGPALLLTNVQPSQAGAYSVVVSNALGSVESASGILTVAPLAFVTPPANMTIYVGESASFAVTLNGTGPFSYQWRFNDTDLIGETNAVLTISNAELSQAGPYSVSVSNQYGSLVSPSASLTVIDSVPIILKQPVSRGAMGPGSSAVFQVTADGSKPLSYQWRFNGVDITAETNTTLTLTGLTAAQAGNYSVRVTNAAGATVSSTATLSLVPITTLGSPVPNLPPAGLSNVVALAAGYNHDLGLKPDGTVISWGSLSTVPANVTNVMAIAAGYNQSLALQSNGTVVAWGGTTVVPAGATNNVVAIAMGSDSSINNYMVLKTDGTVFAWGPKPAITNVPPAVTGIIGIDVGVDHALALKAGGSVVAWGANSFGQTNLPSGLTNIVAIAAGNNHCLALRSNGTVVAWGLNSSGQANVPTSLSNVVAIAAGSTHSIALKSDGTIVMWGLINGAQPNIPPQLPGIVGIAAGNNQSLLLMSTADPAIARGPASGGMTPFQPAMLSVGVVNQLPLTYQWQFKGQNIVNATNAIYKIASVQLANEGNYSVIVSNQQSGAVVSANSKLTVVRNVVVPWGDGGLGQTNVSLTTTKIVSIAAGYDHCLALKADGNVLAWGANGSGQTIVPTSATNVIAIAGGPGHSLALKSNGTVVAWGFTTSPPAGLTNVVAIAAGGNHNLALKLDGTIVCWGSNSFGQCNVPAGLTNVVAIAAGHDHSVALKSDGTLTAWGLNSFGQTNVPANLSNVVMIAAGESHSLALKADGTVVAWGLNNNGQCNVPAGLTNVVFIARGWFHSLAIKAGGTAVGWGGFGPNLPSVVPTGLTDIVSIAGGRLHSIALIATGDPAVARQPLTAHVFAGHPLLLSVGATSIQPLSFRWFFNGVNITGATNASLFLNGNQTTNSGTYSVVVSNALGVVTSSNVAAVVIGQLPFLISQPTNVVAVGGSPATFMVVADGSQPLSYQWWKNGVKINGATTTALQLTGLQRSDAGAYSVIVTNAFGSLTSSNAILRVLVPQKLQSLVPGTDGSMALLFGDSDGGSISFVDAPHFEVRVSSDLITWMPLTNCLSITNGMLLLQDTDATNNPQRFYRVVEMP